MDKIIRLGRTDASILGLIFALEGVSLWRWYFVPSYAFETIMLSALLIYISYVDLQTRIISNWSVGALVIIHSGFLAIEGFERSTNWVLSTVNSITQSLVSGLAMGLLIFITAYVFECVSRRSCLGGGDIKLIAAMGFIVGVERTLYAVLIACVFALLLVVVNKFTNLETRCISGIRENACESTRSSSFAFGPALAFGTELCLLIGA